MCNERPVISFTFDDFPASALHAGGAVLGELGIAATYYAAFGLRGSMQPTGRMFDDEDVLALLEQGHELGSHTYDHCHAYSTPAREFEESVRRNSEAAAALHPGIELRSLSYPISFPRPAIKLRCQRHFTSCRGGGQAVNLGAIDLNCLKSYFLEQSGGDLGAVSAMIENCVRRRGWLIFSTHGVAENPMPYGVRQGFLRDVARRAAHSGAAVLPVSRGLAAVVGGCGSGAAGPPRDETGGGGREG